MILRPESRFLDENGLLFPCAYLDEIKDMEIEKDFLALDASTKRACFDTILTRTRCGGFQHGWLSGRTFNPVVAVCCNGEFRLMALERVLDHIQCMSPID